MRIHLDFKFTKLNYGKDFIVLVLLLQTEYSIPNTID